MSAIFPKLEGLDSLARRDGVDIRPTLVRVLTDLYVQKPAHTAEEERHYTELVLRLIDSVDLATRVAVAKKIAAYAGAPPAVARRLARDVIEVAEPILRHCRRSTTADLDAIVRDFGWSHAAIIATARRAARPQPRCDRRTPQPAHARPHRAGAREVRDRDRRTVLLGRSAARRMLLVSLGSVEAETPQSVQPLETIRALEAAALGRDRVGFTTLIESALGLTREQAERIVARSIRRAAAGRRQGAGDAVGRAAARADVHRSGDRRVRRPGVRSRGALRADERGRRAQDHRERARPRAGPSRAAPRASPDVLRRRGRTRRAAAPRRAALGGAGAAGARAQPSRAQRQRTM